MVSFDQDSVYKLKEFFHGDVEGGCGASIIASRWAITAAHCNERYVTRKGAWSYLVEKHHYEIESLVLGTNDITGVRAKGPWGDPSDVYRFVFDYEEVRNAQSQKRMLKKHKTIQNKQGGTRTIFGTRPRN